MDALRLKHLKKISAISTDFEREIISRIHWDERLICIKGQRGVGKTTAMLQYIKKNFKNDSKALYVSLDDLYFTEHNLVDFAEQFVANGGKYLFLDEVHRYNNWASELKNIYDDMPELNVVFTGSSLLQLHNSKGDLSRRVAFYSMSGLSFREFINFTLKKDFQKITLAEILKNHTSIALELKNEFKPLVVFKQYLQSGYFPFFVEYPKTFNQRVEEIINTTIDVDIMQLKGINLSGISKLKQLLYIIAQSVPFKPNIVKLSERIGVNRNTLITYISHLEQSGILNSIYASAQGIGVLQKPEKIYLENTCFNYALSEKQPDIGNLRETFFLNQVKEKHTVTHTEKGDFLVDDKFTFEIGGSNKGMKQISGLSNGYIAVDDIEIGIDKKIPLWLFGFLY